ncbi:DUF4226 domain-containing protein [Mycobacterium paragordonae]|uniref:DUF4226 domain-containing protein n=1 Tax=Mycobacterium paragordonae TaxID=1389713 RepID=A0ABQ1CFJ7_9MYCO|nr:DUF4226 domain-containing protein [Mycobacterium paragordonae]GFG83219.1 hypothetical protein MPRG_64950 [Mycobacterium paragordonae]
MTTDSPTLFNDGSGAHDTRWIEANDSNVTNNILTWRAPGSDPGFSISGSDGCWDRVLAAARTQYGDPNITWGYGQNPQGHGLERYLTFGDGARLPSDGALVYRDHGRNWLAYPDGRFAPAGSDFLPTAPAFAPAGYVLKDGRYFPINSRGEQIGSQQSALPRPDGWHTTGSVSTPKNKNGDYYEISDPATGARKYFDKNGHPITQQQYENPQAAPGGSGGAPGGSPDPRAVLTGEQNSGAAAAAAKKLENSLQDRNDKALEADRRLAEALLGAHATTAEGAAALNALQRDVEEVINGKPDLDTPAGKQEFQRYINAKLAKIAEILSTASLDAQSQREAFAALTDAIVNRPNLRETETPGGAPAGGSPAPAAAPGGVQPVAADAGGGGGDILGGGGDLGGDLGGGDVLGDALGGGLGGGANPLLSGLGPALGGLSGLPGAAAGIPGSLGGGLGSGLGGLGGLGSGTGEGLGGHGRGRHRKSDQDEDGGDADLSDAFGDSSLLPAGNEHHGEASHDTPTSPVAGAGAAPVAGAPGAATPAGAAPAPAGGAGPTTITLADGTPVTVDNPQLAAALKDIQSGTNPAEAFRNHQIVLPPTTAPPATPLSPGQLHVGSYATYSNGDIVVAFGPDKAWVDGRMQPIAAAAKPGFLGWQNPPAPTAAAAPALPVASLPSAVPAPAAPVAGVVPSPAFPSPIR